MPRLTFTQNIQRHVECPPGDFPGKTVGEVLTHFFKTNERARGYVLDEHGVVRHHMVIFLNGKPIHDRSHLSDPVSENGEIVVMQALSGG